MREVLTLSGEPPTSEPPHVEQPPVALDPASDRALVALATVCFLLGFAATKGLSLREAVLWAAIGVAAAWHGPSGAALVALAAWLGAGLERAPAAAKPPPRAPSCAPPNGPLSEDLSLPSLASPAELRDGSCNSAVEALRAAGEAAWGGSLPVALDDDAHLGTLLAKGRADHPRDAGYARRKLVAAVRWRAELAAGLAPGAAAQTATAHAADTRPGVRRPMGAKALMGAGDGGGECAAPAATHGGVRSVPSVLALLRGARPEPLLSDAALAEAGRTLRSGVFYWHGTDAAGAPILWCLSGLLDMRNVDAAEAERWGRALATMVEIGVVCARARRERQLTLRARQPRSPSQPPPPPPPPVTRFLYVECAAGVSFANMPPRNALRFAKQVFPAVTVGSPERLQVVACAPALRVSRFMWQMCSFLVPPSIRSKVHMWPRVATMVAFLGKTLREPDADLPDFFGGTAQHAPPRTPEGDLDLLAMMRQMVRIDGERGDEVEGNGEG